MFREKSTNATAELNWRYLTKDMNFSGYFHILKWEHKSRIFLFRIFHSINFFYSFENYLLRTFLIFSENLQEKGVMEFQFSSAAGVSSAKDVSSRVFWNFQKDLSVGKLWTTASEFYNISI